MTVSDQNMKANKALQVCKNLKSQSSAYSMIKSLSSNKEPLLLVTLHQLDLYLYGKVIKVSYNLKPLNSIVPGVYGLTISNFGCIYIHS